MKTYQHLFAVITCSLVMACGPSGSSSTDDDTTKVDAGPNDICLTGETRCIGQSYQTCNAGVYEDSQTCSAGQVCSTAGCQDCIEGTNVCLGNEVHACVAGGVISDDVQETCSGGLQCSGGACIDLCKDADDNASYIGCEYWAVDLDNAIEVFGAAGALGCMPPPLGPGGTALSGVPVCYDGNVTNGLCEAGGTCSAAGFTCQTIDVCGYDAQHSAFAVVVSNPQLFAVNVTISNGAGVTKTEAVAAGAVKELYPQQLGFPDQSINGSGVTSSAYKISSDAPIVAYQFNPLDNQDVFSNDGSLLIPRSTFDNKYYALTWPTLNRRRVEGPAGPFSPNPTNDYNGYLTVVAWEDNTEVTITASANVRLGTGFAAMPAGSSRTITLNAFDTLNLEAGNTDAAPEQDLTGTVVEGPDGSSFGVFAGHEAVIIQNTPQSCCADHVEEMMFPASTWGEAYAIARSASRGQNEPDLLRIMAQADGTTVTITPAGDVACPTLNAGEFCDVKISGDHTVTSPEGKPILIGHYLLSVMTSGQGDGDPALALAVPTEQFRRNYTFLAPAQYNRQFVSVVAKANSTVALDGVNVTDQLVAFADGSFLGARIEVQPGQHSVECSAGCGIEIYGYSDAVSYLFAGGLDLQKIFVD